MTARFFQGRTTALFGVAAAAVAALAFDVPASAVSPGRLQPANTGLYSESVAGSYVLGAANTDASDPFNDYAIEGTIPNDVGGVGLLGYANAPKSYAVYGVTFGTNGIGVYGAGDGPTPAPGATPSSTQQSTGVAGDSHSGAGVYGSTEFPNSSSVTVNPVGGVTGVDVDGVHDNIGVLGITTGGGYGVEGMSGTDAYGGVFGLAADGIGVTGESTSGIGGDFSSGSDYGLFASSGSSHGIVGETSSGSGVSGVLGAADNSGSYGVWGSNSSSGIAVYATSTSGDAIYATSDGGIGAYVRNSAGNGADIGGSYIGVVTRSPAGTGSYPIVATDASSNDLFYVNGNGDVAYGGTLTSFARTRHGFTATAYGARSSAPTIEDVGTGQLVNGQALVRLDPALVEQMDQSSAYHVFLTPDGDTRGLFVAGKTSQGFVVREVQGGRGTLAFDYRVVGALDGQANRRMSLSSAAAGPHAPQPANLSAAKARRPAWMSPGVLPRKRAARGGAARPPASDLPRPNLAVERRRP